MSILSDMSTVTPGFFWYLFACNIFYHPLTFSLYVSLGFMWVSCRQHTHGLCFCIYSGILCLLVGAFNPFTFRVIFDMYVPITIFFIVLHMFLWSFSSPVFSAYRSLFSICCKAGLVVLNSLIFCLVVKILISLSNLSHSFAG